MRCISHFYYIVYDFALLCDRLSVSVLPCIDMMIAGYGIEGLCPVLKNELFILWLRAVKYL